MLTGADFENKEYNQEIRARKTSTRNVYNYYIETMQCIGHNRALVLVLNKTVFRKNIS